LTNEKCYPNQYINKKSGNLKLQDLQLPMKLVPITTKVVSK